MNLLVGLGNKGKKYQGNRHNVGFWFVDRVFEVLKTEDLSLTYERKFNSLISVSDNLILAKPQTMMNSSGLAVSKIVSFYQVAFDKLWLAYDDLDIQLGQYKIIFGKPPKTHNGVYSVIEKLGDSSFWHIRLGVDNRNRENREMGEKTLIDIR